MHFAGAEDSVVGKVMRIIDPEPGDPAKDTDYVDLAALAGTENLIRAERLRAALAWRHEHQDLDLESFVLPKDEAAFDRYRAVIDRWELAGYPEPARAFDAVERMVNGALRGQQGMWSGKIGRYKPSVTDRDSWPEVADSRVFGPGRFPTPKRFYARPLLLSVPEQPWWPDGRRGGLPPFGGRPHR
jgi:hypothetical protein